jgi:hypothetical protein
MIPDILYLTFDDGYYVYDDSDYEQGFSINYFDKAQNPVSII